MRSGTALFVLVLLTGAAVADTPVPGSAPAPQGGAPGTAAVLPESIPDSVAALNRSSKVLSDTDPARSKELAQRALELSLRNGDRSGAAYSFHNLGIAERNLGHLEVAFDMVTNARQGFAALEDTKNEANTLNTLGLIHFDRGDGPAALESHLEALRLRRSINDEQGLAYSYNNIGNVYRTMGAFDKALEFHRQSLASKERLGDVHGQAWSHQNIGNTYRSMGDREKARESYEKALAIRERLGDKKSLSGSYNVLGTLYEKTEPRRAHDYFVKALALRREIDDVRGIAGSLNNLANAKRLLGRPADALPLLAESERIATESGATLIASEANLYASEALTDLGRHAEALARFKEYIRLKDSLNETDKTKRLTELTSRFENREKEREIALLKKDRELSDARKERETIAKWAAAIAALLLFGLALALWNRGRIRKAGEERYRRKSEELDAQARQLDAYARQLREALDLVQASEARALESEKAALEASRIKSAFLANTSHELRTPLNAIIGYAEILAEDARAGGTNAAAAADLEKIRHSGHHLLGLIDAILDISKVESGKMELHLEEFDARDLVDDVTAIAQPLAEKKGNQFVIVASPTLGTGFGDVVKLKQVLLNLAGNAAKFTEKGRITLRASRDVSSRGDDLVFEIEDTGIGMTEEQLGKVFQPFVQADAGTTRRFGGTGLGLSIAKRFVELLRGELTVESTPGQGTTFTVRVPRRLDRRGSAQLSAAALREAAAAVRG